MEHHHLVEDHHNITSSNKGILNKVINHMVMVNTQPKVVNNMHLTQLNPNMDKVIQPILLLLVTVNIQLIPLTSNNMVNQLVINNSHMVNLAKPLTQLIILLPQITNHHVNDQLIFQFTKQLIINSSCKPQVQLFKKKLISLHLKHVQTRSFLPK